MKKYRVGFIVFGLVAYCLFLVAAIPADRAFQVLQKRSEFLANKVWFSGLTGTVWSGMAPEAMIAGKGCRNLGWDFLPAGLLLGRLNVVIRCKVQDGTLRGILSLGRGGVVFRDMELDLPAALVAEQLRTMGIGVSGNLSARIERLAIRQGRIIAAAGTVLLGGAQVGSGQPVGLGDLKMELTTKDGAVQGVLSDGGGPLAVQGTVTLATEGAYELKGSLQARDRSQPLLVETIQLLGRPDKDGAVQMALSGRLPEIVF